MHTRKRLTVAISAVVLLANQATGAVVTPDFSELESTVASELARTKTPGCAIAIVRGESVVFLKTFGIANVETGEPLRPEMLFRIGSTTKMLTAAALIRLAIEGKVDLSQPIGNYLPNLVPRLSMVTANQLLSHTAGLYDTAPAHGLHDESALGDGIRGWTNDRFLTDPGKVYSYSNPGYWVAGYLLEVVSGERYADAMQSRLFHPLGMTRTTLRPLVAMTYPLAVGHNDSENGTPFIPRPAADNAGGWPAGSVYTNVIDLSRFLIAFLNEGKLDGKQVLEPRVIELMTTPHASIPDSPVNSYGYGLILTRVRGVRIFDHGGATTGYGSTIRMAPDHRFGLVILTNRRGAGMPASTTKALELMLPLETPAAASTSRTDVASEITPDDLQQHVGVYRNGPDQFEITAQDGGLLITRGNRTVPFTKQSANQFHTKGMGRYIIVSNDGRGTQLIFCGGRAFAKAH